MSNSKRSLSARMTDGMSDTGLQRSISPSTMALERRSMVGKESVVGFQTM
jgi:hypothetical protein